jgi:hypothetical protein
VADRPILSAIRALLQFKDSASIAEIAKMAGVTQRRALDVINANGEFVFRFRKTGRITKVDPRSKLREQLWKSGRFYRPGTYGLFSVEGHCLEFEGNAELRKQIQEGRAIGAFGDSALAFAIIDTPENRAAVEAAGLALWSDSLVDDRLWNEEVAANG